MYAKYLKRILDLLIALILLILLSPLLIIIYILLKIKVKKPIFIQQRIGKDEKIFNIYKFKSLNDELDSKGLLKADKKREFYLGKLLRQSSLDELPQLINVIKADMSLIGPRPLLPEYLGHFSAKAAKRHSIRPGISGLAQIKGRNNISWEQKFEYDIFYLQNISFSLDAKIFLLTIIKLFNIKDIKKAKVRAKKFKK